MYDGFDIDGEGSAWIATHPDLLLEVAEEGDDNGKDLVQPTSARSRRGFDQEEKILYIVTAGSETFGGQGHCVRWCILVWYNQKSSPYRS